MVTERFSVRLLDHDRLMTPLLERHFGEIYAIQRNVEETDETFSRAASLYQRSSSVLLLDAELEISKGVLPAEIFDALRATDRPFGQLLIDRGIEGVSVERTLFNVGEPGSPDLRWGRRHSLVETRTGHLLCRAQELLVPERDLIAAHDRLSRAANDDN